MPRVFLFLSETGTATSVTTLRSTTVETLVHACSLEVISFFTNVCSTENHSHEGLCSKPNKGQAGGDAETPPWEGMACAFCEKPCGFRSIPLWYDYCFRKKNITTNMPLFIVAQFIVVFVSDKCFHDWHPGQAFMHASLNCLNASHPQTKQNPVEFLLTDHVRN